MNWQEGEMQEQKINQPIKMENGSGMTALETRAEGHWQEKGIARLRFG
jgi:hypothetical protein